LGENTVINSIASEKGNNNGTTAKYYDTCDDHINEELRAFISYAIILQIFHDPSLTLNGRPKVVTVDFITIKATTIATNVKAMASAALVPSVNSGVISSVSGRACVEGLGELGRR